MSIVVISVRPSVRPLGHGYVTETESHSSFHLYISFLSQNRGIYMFRVNEDLVVDATVTGGPARYINHSCSPNCSAEVVELEKGGKIIIVTNRRICRGEEVREDCQR